MTTTGTDQARATSRELVEAALEQYAHASADEILAWVAATVPGRIAVASSMADTALPHLVSQHLPGVEVLFLDTGYHFPQTLQTRDAVGRRLDVTIRTLRPDLDVAAQDRLHGPDLFARDPAACCALRKVAPLTAALKEYDLWITGVRRTESPTRAMTPIIEWDETFGLIKVNPLVAWSDDEVETYLRDNDIPVNPLLTQGYPSIGCAPCTARVEPGADPRSGRWSGFEKTECGLHPAAGPTDQGKELS